jgi:hypothetical protein
MTTFEQHLKDGLIKAGVVLEDAARIAEPIVVLLEPALAPILAPIAAALTTVSSIQTAKLQGGLAHAQPKGGGVTLTDSQLQTIVREAVAQALIETAKATPGQ